jgi:hypothetical protein
MPRRAQFRTTLTGLVEQVGIVVLVTRETIAAVIRR